MPEEKIQLKHPEDKHMPHIERKKYEALKKAMLSVLEGKELTHTELFNALDNRLKGEFEGNISWYAKE
jgi:hypothetical protein